MREASGCPIQSIETTTVGTDPHRPFRTPHKNQDIVRRQTVGILGTMPIPPKGIPVRIEQIESSAVGTDPHSSFFVTEDRPNLLITEGRLVPRVVYEGPNATPVKTEHPLRRADPQGIFSIDSERPDALAKDLAPRHPNARELPGFEIQLVDAAPPGSHPEILTPIDQEGTDIIVAEAGWIRNTMLEPHDRTGSRIMKEQAVFPRPDPQPALRVFEQGRTGEGFGSLHRTPAPVSRNTRHAKHSLLGADPDTTVTTSLDHPDQTRRRAVPKPYEFSRFRIETAQSPPGGDPQISSIILDDSPDMIIRK